jgi:ankyrin repeat protein
MDPHDIAQLNVPNPTNGYTLLHGAAECGSTSIVSLLLQLQADPHARTHEGCTPLHLAAQHNRLEAAELLMRAGASLNACNERGQTPLHVACSGDMIELLLQCRIDTQVHAG